MAISSFGDALESGAIVVVMHDLVRVRHPEPN
jgi:hypothetical protein